MMQLVVGAFDRIKVALEPETARFINALLLKEYVNEFQGT